MRIGFVLIIAVIYSLILSSCTGGYSFTGADISADIKTVSISHFPNRASMVQPSLSNVFSETLRDKFISQTNLSLVSSDGDLSFEGEITNYTVNAQAFTGNETAALNRLTITVRVQFTNSKEPTKSFDTNFSRYADFESTLSLTAVEEELIKQISDEIVTDIFNRAVANW